MVETEQSAETLTPLHLGSRAYRGWCSLQEPVVEALMVSLAIVVLDVLSHAEGGKGPSPSWKPRTSKGSSIGT